MRGGTGRVVGSRILYRRWPITAGVPVAGAHCGERRAMTALEGMIGRCVNSCSGRIQWPCGFERGHVGGSVKSRGALVVR